MQAEALEARWTPSLTPLASLLDGPQGINPYGTLIEDSNGNLFGTTFGGNPAGDGTVYEVNSTTGTITTLAVFAGPNGANPEGGLVEDSNGNLFGTTSAGGSFNEGTIFEIPKGGTLTTLVNFNGKNGSNPSNETLLLDSSGNLFGTTRNGGSNFTTHQTGNGTVFELQGGSTLISLASFAGTNGSSPFAGLVEDSKGDLFGTASSGGASNDGTVFEVQAGTSTITPLASFSGTNGAQPECTLLIDSAGNIMGTTTAGGTSNAGTIFALSAGSSTIASLASFNAAVNGSFPRAGLVEDAFGDFFGTALYGGTNFNSSYAYSGDGSLFEFSTATDAIAPVVLFSGAADGSNPSAGLLRDSSGNLFGAAVSGGPGNLNYGTVFELPSGATSITSIAAFPGSVGAAPYGGLVQDSSGNLFGTADAGGPQGYGSVFELAKGTSTVTALATFNGTNGANPEGNLIEDSNGNLFGTTIGGGGSDLGTVFELAKGSSTITTLVSFDGIHGQAPYAGLVEDSNGNLFGTTFGSYPPTSGVAVGNGTIFEIPGGTTTLTTLATLGGGTGTNPQGGLVEDANGDLFGATVYGGPSGYGTVFELPFNSSTSTYGNLVTLASFNGSNGAYPLATLLRDSSGNLFGTAFDGGAFGIGVVFEVKQGGTTITDLASFSGANGAYPFSGLLETSSGMLIGTTPYGGSGYSGPQTGFGVVFEVPVGGGTITDLGLFQGTNGAQPAGTLIQDSKGNLIGPTVNGGVAGFGTIFTYATSAPVAITTTSLPNGTAGTAYNQTIHASGGTGSLTFSSTGTLPPGLTLSTVGVLSGTPTTGGSYTFTVTAGDSSGNTASQTYTIIIYGQATTLALNVPSIAAAGTSFSITITAQDAGGNTATTYNGTVTLSSSQGADISPTTVTLNNGTATVSVTLTGAGSQTITASATGLTSANASVTVSAGPFDHYVMTIISGPSQVQAGSQLLVTVQAVDKYGNSVSSYTGPAVMPMVSPSTGASFPSTVSLNAQGFALFLVALDRVGSYTISVSGGTISSNTGSVSVMPGMASMLGFGVQPVNTATGVTLPAVTVQVEDMYGNVITGESGDTVVISVATGPGTFTSTSTTTATVTAGVATFNNLTLAVPGTYALGAVVPATYTGPNSNAFTVLPLQVVPGSLVGTPSGFSLQFNAPILVDSTTPVLYGASTTTTPSPPPSLIVTTDPGNLGDTAAYVAGSLVLRSANNSLTFLATDTTLENNNNSPILPDGVYTVILHGSAAGDGFQALAAGGGYLDGKGSGTPGSGDFVATFTVGAAAAKDDVVWVPPTADGPGQALNGPGLNQLGSGYPIYLDASTGSVTSVNLTLNYDPTLLTVTGVHGAGFSLSGTSTSGHAVLQYSGPALPSGSQTLVGYLTATVPGGTAANPTPYKAKDLLDLSNVALNGGAVQVVTSDGLHLVAYAGDADGNGSYSSGDAVLITRAILQTDTGFAAYPQVDPTVLADTDGSGFVPSDAPLQANEAGVGVKTANLPVPPIPAGVHFQPTANNVDPTLSLAVAESLRDSDLAAGSTPASRRDSATNGTVTVAVNIDDAHPAGSTGLIEGHLALTYNPSLFTVSAADVHAGSLLAGGGWSIVPTVDPASGQIGIALSSSTPITSTAAGSLVTIDFHANPGEPGGVSPRFSNPSSIALVATATPDSQFVRTELEDAQGTFTLTPAPTSVFDPRLDSVIQLAAAPTASALGSVAGDVLPSFRPVASVVAVDTPTLAEDEPVAVSPVDVSAPAARSPSGDSSAPAPVIIASAVSEVIGHATPVLVAAALPAVSSLGLAVPLTAAPLFSAPAVAARLGQALSDPSFPVRLVGNPVDAAFTTMREVLERVLPSWPRVPSTADTLDFLDGNQLDGDPNPVTPDAATLLLPDLPPLQPDLQQLRPGLPTRPQLRPGLPTRPPVPTEGFPSVDHTAADRYFAQMSDDTTASDDWLADASLDDA